MTKMRSPWLDPDARALVRRAATIEGAPAAARARVRARVAAVVASGRGDATESRHTPHPASGPLLRGGTRALAIAAAFALGGGVGALVMHRLGHEPPTEVTIAPSIRQEAPTAIGVPPVNGVSAKPAPTVSALPVPPPAPPAASAIAERTPVVAARERPVPPAPAPGFTGAALDPVADERKLLDEARVAVEREDGAAALAATEEHARRYPRGVLVQEREAIAVRALVLLDRGDEARARVERFRTRFPDSLLLPALESTAGVPPAP